MKPHEIEALVDARVEIKVREVLTTMLGLNQTLPETKRQYYPTSQAWKLLDFDNQDQLYDAVSSGLLRLGIEVSDRRKPQSAMPRYYFNIEACQQRLAELPEKRK